MQAFTHEVEAAAGLEIEVVPNEQLNSQGPFGSGKLRVHIAADSVELEAPTNGYFPDGAVRHELLHVNRFLVEAVPRIALSDCAPWNEALRNSLVDVDNALEHLVVVPRELEHHPERLGHWEAVMANVWGASLPEAGNGWPVRLWTCLHWAFVQQVLPNSASIDTALEFMQKRGYQEMAGDFASHVLPLVGCKEEVVGLLFDWFQDLPRASAALEYLNSMTGTRQEPIP